MLVHVLLREDVVEEGALRNLNWSNNNRFMSQSKHATASFSMKADVDFD